MNMLLTAVLVCLSLIATAEPIKQTLQQLMEAKLNEVHREMREEISKQNLEINELKVEHAKQSKSYREQLDAAVKDQLEMRKRIQSMQGKLTSDLEIRMAHVEGNLALIQHQVINTQTQLTSVDNQVIGVHTEVVEMEHSLNDAHKLIADVEKNVEIIDERIDAIEGEATDGGVGDRLDDIESRQVKQQQATQQLQDSLEELHATVTELQTNNEGFEKEIKDIQVNLVNQTKESEQIGIDVKELQENDEDITSTLKDLTERVANIDTGGASGEHYSFMADLTHGYEARSCFTIVYDRVHYNHNSSYDPSTGHYTVPVDGLYLFTASALLKYAQCRAELYLIVDGRLISTFASSTGLKSGYNSMSVMAQLQLQAGQKISVRVDGVTKVQGDEDSDFDTWFSGHLI